MTHRRPKLPPDTRLDWRDPDMPVIRQVVWSTPMGQRWVTVEELPPEQETAQAKEVMAYQTPEAPHWTQDPTYHLTNRRKRL